MKAVEFTDEVDERHHLQIALPSSVLPGQARVIILTPEPEEDEAGGA